MIGDFLLKLHLLLSRNKSAFFIFLLSFILFLGYGISKLKVTESIFATLPKGQAFEDFNRLIENKNMINQVLFTIQLPDTISSEDAFDLAEQFGDSLHVHASSYLKNIQATHPDIQNDVYDYIYAHFPQFIDAPYYAHIDHQTNPDSISTAIVRTYQMLLTPAGAFLKSFLIKDPLSITTPYFQALNVTSNAKGIIVEDGVMYTHDKKALIISAYTQYDTGNSDLNVQLLDRIESLQSHWNTAYPVNQLTYFGTFEIAARNAMQIKKDSMLTLTIALGSILLLLFFYYRKWSMPLLMVLPGLFGGIFALGIIGLIHPEISGISLATGAIIFGILLDYAFHFFTHLKHTASLDKVIKEVSEPLLTGSFTTVMAFSALHFANSAVLQDFGLFASLSLLGAAGFTLIALPVLLSSFRFDFSGIHSNDSSFQLPLLSKNTRNWLVGITVILTFAFLYFARYTSFDSNLENLSLQDAELKNKEFALTNLDPTKEKRIYVFASGKTQVEAEQINYTLYKKLQQYKNDHLIAHFQSPGDFLIPPSVAAHRDSIWQNYWSLEKKAVTFNAIDAGIKKTDFQNDAFEDLKNWIDQKPQHVMNRDTLLSVLGLNRLIESNSKGTTIISTVVVSQKNLEMVKANLRSISGIEIFDRGELAGELLNQVQADFNYILFISAGIVFFTLLLIYGRIELTLLTFIPMVISWIWILGIAVLLDIQFNFVNVILTTFIFGLGDDFSIFVTDGLLAKYKARKDSLKSYQSAILLSGLTTIIGTGVLIFAKHPAIKSIAVVSMLGIACILFISFIIQPFLFDVFVQNRVDNQKAPITFVPWLISINSFMFFVSGCLILHSLLVTILLLPVPRLKKKRWINYAISKYAKSVIYSGPHVKKNITGQENLQVDKPVIFIANHTSFLDILLVIMLHPKIVMMVKGWVYHSPFFGFIIRYAGYLHADVGPEEHINQMKKRIEEGYSLMIFPEGTRSENGKIGRFHKGAFHLAQALNLEIQPIQIHGAAEVLQKNNFLIRNGVLNVRVLPRISMNDSQWGDTLRDKTKNIAAYFKETFSEFRTEMEDTHYLKSRIFTNYVYKGPVLEWYFKSKWRLEHKNFENYDKLIGQRNQILDIGCGYGYLSFYLHYRNQNRIIQGVDFDEDKITIAANSYNKSDRLQFTSANIMHFPITAHDVIFLNDVLHYLTADQQKNLLNRCVSALKPDGIIFIRDGITDSVEKHRNTLRTESLSTGFFSFNKKENDFHFFSSQDIIDFAALHHLSVSIQEHSRNTSNVLFILRKSTLPAVEE
jgi:1-acyl-sn-glycerol-3-phosphate acyltransferase